MVARHSNCMFLTRYFETNVLCRTDAPSKSETHFLTTKFLPRQACAAAAAAAAAAGVGARTIPGMGPIGHNGPTTGPTAGPLGGLPVGPGMVPPFQKFCLRWNNHGSNLSNTLSSALATQQHSDVTLACQGELGGIGCRSWASVEGSFSDMQ